MTDTILAALREAVEYLEHEREDLLASFCPTRDGCLDVDAIDLDGKPFVDACDALISNLTAAIAAREAEGWLPIETAPKDGTHIQAIQYTGNPIYDAVTMRWWRAAEMRKASGIKKGSKEDCFESGWWSRNGWIGPHETMTHWRPLPKPPSAP